MCTPTAALGMQVAGGVGQTVGSFYAAQSQQAALRGQAMVADVGARSVLLAGQRAKQSSQLATANLKGRQRATMAANGVDLSTGTPANILTGTDVLGQADAAAIEHNALMSAWGYQTEAASARSAAGAISPLTSAATTLLGSASSIAGSWYRLNEAGAFGAKPSPGDGLSQGERRKLGVY